MLDDALADETLVACKSVMKADNLQIWMDPPPRNAGPTKPAPRSAPDKPDAEPLAGGRKVRRVEATGHVTARSPEMRILERAETPTQRLSIFFKDMPAPPAAPASTAAAQPGPAAPPPGTPPVKPAPGPEPITVPPADAPAKPARPVELSAVFITAHVLRYDPTGKTELDRLETEGKVHVVQAPSGENKGFNVRGEKLEMTRKLTGNHLKVISDPANLAELHTDRLGIVGPEIEIDQGENTATVDGDGYMTMESTTDFQGNPLQKPELLTVFWNNLMRFEGSFAEFHGNIHAEQASSRLWCQMLQVYFDRPISLSDQRKTGKKPANGQDSAKAKKLVCDRSVKVEQEIYEVRYRLTDAAMPALRTAGVPEPILIRLAPVKDRIFETKEKLSEEVARLLTRAELDRYQNAVVSHSAFEPEPRRLAGFKSLDCVELTVQNLERTMSAEGPGVVRIIQPGGGPGTLNGPAGAKPATKPDKPAGEDWTLTLVTYGRFGGLGANAGSGGRMDADNNTHTALFLEDVQVLHLPWTPDPRQLRTPIKVADVLGRLPMGALYMECRRSLKIYSPDGAPGAGPSLDGGGKHIMTGIGKVYVKSVDSRGQLFWGSAEEVHFDEAKDQLIFDGKDGLAEVYQVEHRGDEPKKFKGARSPTGARTAASTATPSKSAAAPADRCTPV